MSVQTQYSQIIFFYILNFVLLSLSFIFLISLLFELYISLIILFIFTILLIIAVFMSQNLIQKIYLMINVFLVYLIYYFFIQSFTINFDYFYEKQKLTIFLKLLIFYIPSFIIILDTRKLYKKYLIFYTYFIFLLFVFFINNLTLMQKSMYIINSFLPILILFFLLKKIKFYKIQYSLFNILFYLYIISLLINFFILGDLIQWNKEFFYKLYENTPFALVNDLPRTWFTTFLGLDLFRRFNGTLADPIIFGYLSSLMLLISIYSKDKKRFLTPLILFFLLISLSKGSFLFFILVIILNYIKFNIIYKKFSLWILFVIIVLSITIILSSNRGSSADIHFLGLGLPFAHIFDYSIIQIFFGHGFTSGGNLAKGLGIVDEFTWLLTGSESGIGTIFYQTGIIGLLFIITMFYKQIIESNLYTKNFITVYFILMFTQENLINLNYLIFLFIGILFFNNLEKDLNAKK